MNIEISTEKLRLDIRTVQDEIDALSEVAELVIGQMGELSNMWEGGAHDAFVSQMATDTQMLTELIASIRNMAECMEYAKSEYDRCHEDVLSKIASIRLSDDT